MDSCGVQADTLQLVTFRVAGQRYAVDILKVQEIDLMREFARIPNAPSYVEGAMNLRGRVIPVLNIRRLFRLDEGRSEGSSKIVIMDVQGIVMGVIVDAVSDVLRIPHGAVEPPPPVSSAMSTEFIRGIVKLDDGLVILLDLDKLLGSAEYQTAFGLAGRP